MIKYSFYTLLVTAMLLVSCVDRKTSESSDTQNEEKVVRLEDKTTKKVPDSDTRNPDMNNEQDKEIADAKGVINDYYDAFTRKKPREAYDMWDPKKAPSDFGQFSKDNPNYEKISVAFQEGATEQKMGKDKQVTMPTRVSATNEDGDVVNFSGNIILVKKEDDDNPTYKITAMDLKKEDS